MPLNFRTARQSQTALPNGAYVYVVESTHGHVKIGFSSDPTMRLATLQTGSAVPLTLAHSVFAGDHAADVEAAAHAFLAPRRLSGEWFDANAETAIAAIYAAAGRLGVSLGDDAFGVGPPKFFQTFLGKLALIAVIAILLFLVSKNT